MGVKELGIIVHGATGRIGSTQHLANALAPICAEGGVVCGTNRILPKLLLVGRNAERLAVVAGRHGITEWTTDIDAALGRPDYSVFLDAATTRQRVDVLHKAIAAGKHIYSEKPVAPTVEEGLALLRAAQARGLKHAAVEDKVYLPGLQKLMALAREDFFGRITGFRLDFGWWVFDGAERPSQRPSWNYRRAGGGGMTSDMYPHWRYVIESILGPIRRVVAATATGIPGRVDENGDRFAVDVDDVSMTLAELASGAIGAVICSWATRVRRDDLLTLQVDGTRGSAVAGVHRCWMQSAAETPTVRHINPDVDLGVDYRQGWREAPGAKRYSNPYR
ncbi:MAG TPA: Gfo/Idh/MocA family oxidoreductase, partial [Pseudolabrys sp.]|nr:Gfo/Idh/MocA family oxidoreductase [Pseudolabrys sp.]